MKLLFGITPLPSAGGDFLCVESVQVLVKHLDSGIRLDSHLSSTAYLSDLGGVICSLSFLNFKIEISSLSGVILRTQ